METDDDDDNDDDHTDDSDDHYDTYVACLRAAVRFLSDHPMWAPVL